MIPLHEYSYFNAVEVPLFQRVKVFLIFGCYTMLLYILVTSLEKCARVFPDAYVAASAVAAHRHEWPQPDQAVHTVPEAVMPLHTPAAVLRACSIPHQLQVLSDLVFTPVSGLHGSLTGVCFPVRMSIFSVLVSHWSFLFCEVPVQGVCPF